MQLQASLEPKMPGAGARRKTLTVASIGLVCGLAFVCWRQFELHGVEAVLRTLGAAAPLISIPAHVLLSATPFPSELVGVGNGAVYGLGLGTLYSWLGWWLGSIVEFEMVRRSAGAFIQPEQTERTLVWLRRFPADHPAFLIIGRQLPFGFHVVNISAGLAKVSPGRFVACSAIANVPYAVLTTAAGAGLMN